PEDPPFLIASVPDRIEGTVLDRFALRGGCDDAIDRIDLCRSRPSCVRHHAVLVRTVRELDRLGALTEQVDDRGAAEREVLLAYASLEIGDGAVEVDEGFELVAGL